MKLIWFNHWCVWVFYRLSIDAARTCAASESWHFSVLEAGNRSPVSRQILIPTFLLQQYYIAWLFFSVNPTVLYDILQAGEGKSVSYSLTFADELCPPTLNDVHVCLWHISYFIYQPADLEDLWICQKILTFKQIKKIVFWSPRVNVSEF